MILPLSGCLVDFARYEARLHDLTDNDGDGFVYEDDCDDANAVVHPDAIEVCDGLDQDCDGAADDAAVDAAAWYPDTDGDGLGASTGEVVLCSAPSGFVSSADDCDDANAGAQPGADEVPYDAIDQDCDGVDASDLDGDGHAGGSGDDCDDADASVHPDAPEAWADAFTDNDCDAALELDAPELFGGEYWNVGVDAASFGSRVHRYGDLDGDGADEILVASVGRSREYTNSGVVYLVSSAGSGDADAGALRTFEGGGVEWYLSSGLDAGRDLDADGLPDVLITATGVEDEGRAFLVPGDTLLAGSVLLPDDAAAVYEGVDRYAYWGSDVAYVGDVDGDGAEDMALAASYAPGENTAIRGRVAVFPLDGGELHHGSGHVRMGWVLRRPGAGRDRRSAG